MKNEEGFESIVNERFQDIVSKCKQDTITHIWINLKPCGRILAQSRKLGTVGKPCVLTGPFDLFLISYKSIYFILNIYLCLIFKPLFSILFAFTIFTVFN